MSVNLLEVNNLKKSYLDFELDNISLSIPRGTIVGLIGQNGAGKSTTLNIIHNLVKKDSGNVIVFGEILENLTNLAKNQIGVVFDGGNLPDTLTVNQLNTIFKNIYDGWDEKYFLNVLVSFHFLKRSQSLNFLKE
ncbi:ATP-binding cassette domain-containing protein [Enterococcus olivae]